MIKQDVKWFVYISFMLVFWVVFSFDGIYSAIKIWTISEVFNHCYIVLPASAYLIWERRKYLAKIPVSPTLLPLPILIGQIFVYLFGLAGDIQVFMHIATFTMLPLLIWIAVGHAVAKAIIFPLFFLVFAIPIGEELVPTLQEVTADFSVMLLDVTGIPLYRSGLYIEIPQGKFLVAEACSGISFLIASIVLGNLYAYMNLVTWKARILFVALSIIFPIFANVLRVYGIILIGYWSDMKHAVGADHLIYGWFFFAFVLVCLFLLGEFIRRRETVKLKQATSKNETDPCFSDTQATSLSMSMKTIHLIPLVVLILGVVKAYDIANPEIHKSANNYVFDIDYAKTDKGIAVSRWAPEYKDSAFSFQATYANNEDMFSVFTAIYQPGKGELVSSQNRVYIQDRWSFASRTSELSSSGFRFNKHYISSARGEYMRVYFVYLIGEQVFTSKIKAKLYQTWLTVIGDNNQSAILALAFDGANNSSLSDAENDALNTALNEVKELIDI